MPNIKFYCDKSKYDKNGLSPIKANIAFNSKNHWKTIEKVKARYWKENRQQVEANRESETYNRSEEINNFLKDFEYQTRQFFNDCKLYGVEISSELIYNFMNGKKPQFGNEKDFTQTFEDWVKFTKTNLEHNTYRSRNSVYNFFQDFQNDESFRITFKNIDMLLFDRLKQYAFSEKKNYANNTFAKTIKVLRIFLNWCEERGYFTGKLPKGFKASERDITPITLTVDEFKTLYSKDFESKKHQKTRDIFCFGCLTGLRYSDLMRVRRDMIQDGYLYLTIKKVKEPKKIPLVDMAITILNRYKEHPVYALPHISNQKFNDYLKEVCEVAEIKAPVTIDIYSGNKWKQETRPKHKLITAHVARKTFITLSFYLGMNIKVVQEITGIKQEATLRKYLQIADQMKQEEMQKAWGKL